MNRGSMWRFAALSLFAGGALMGCCTSEAGRERAALVAEFPSWFVPSKPFRVIGPIHAVGPQGLSVFFIPTEAGHILIDGGLPQNAGLVASNIEKLGYKVTDIKVLLNTHAHFDHAGGLARLKDMSGAALAASQGDRSALENGVYLGSEEQRLFRFPKVAVDRIVKDGEVVSVGGVDLTAHMTPGHTRGCTSWTLTVEEGGAPYDVLIFCSASVAANRLVGPPQYEGIVADYRRTFDKTRHWKPDVFLSNHPFFFGMAHKKKRLEEGDALAFVGPEDFPAHIAKMEARFEAALANQLKERGD